MEKLETLDKAIQTIAKIKGQDGEDISKSEFKKNVNEIISKNMKKLVRKCEQGAEKVPHVSTLTKVTKARSFSGLYKVAIGALAIVSLLSNVSRATNLQVGIQEQEEYQTSIVEMTDSEIDDSYVYIETTNEGHTNAGNEAVEIGDEEAIDSLGINDAGGAELAARDEKLTNVEQLQGYQTKIDDVIMKYNQIKNPTNVQWLEHQKELASIYQEVLAFQGNLNEKTNEYLELWNQLNLEHIGQNIMSDRAIRSTL